jgi:hypothetical protein
MSEKITEDSLHLLDICKKCNEYITFLDDLCINCYVPDFIDAELLYEDK